MELKEMRGAIIWYTRVCVGFNSVGVASQRMKGHGMEDVLTNGTRFVFAEMKTIIKKEGAIIMTTRMTMRPCNIVVTSKEMTTTIDTTITTITTPTVIEN
jgi:hypothetical protein